MVVSAEVLTAAEGVVRRILLTAPFPAGRETPQALVTGSERALYRFYDGYGDLL